MARKKKEEKPVEEELEEQPVKEQVDKEIRQPNVRFIERTIMPDRTYEVGDLAIIEDEDLLKQIVDKKLAERL